MTMQLRKPLDFFSKFDNDDWKPLIRKGRKNRYSNGFLVDPDKIYFTVYYDKKHGKQSKITMLIGMNILNQLNWTQNDKILICVNPNFELHMRLEKVDPLCTGIKLKKQTFGNTHMRLVFGIKSVQFIYNPVQRREVEYYIEKKTNRLLLVLDDSLEDKKDV
jgi:hypothetical protein